MTHDDKRNGTTLFAAMNFIDGELTADAGGATFVSGEVRVQFGHTLAGHATLHADHPLVLGLRPEHFLLDSAAVGSGAPTLDVAVQVVEPLGAQMDIYGTLANGQRVLARTEAQPI